MLDEYTSDQTDKMIDYMYDNFSECKILLEASADTGYANFVNEFIEIEEDYTHKYINFIGCSINNDQKIDNTIIHMVTTAYFESFFEVIRHNVDKQKAKEYINILGKYHLSGFKSVFNLD